MNVWGICGKMMSQSTVLGLRSPESKAISSDRHGDTASHCCQHSQGVLFSFRDRLPLRQERCYWCCCRKDSEQASVRQYWSLLRDYNVFFKLRVRERGSGIEDIPRYGHGLLRGAFLLMFLQWLAASSCGF